MPIDDSEWENGRVDPDQSEPAPAPVGEYDTERDLVLAFLDENADEAFTAREILLGVDFDRSEDPDTVRSEVAKVSPRGSLLGRVGDEIVDAVGDLVASGLVLGDVEAALAELAEEGLVEGKEIDVGDETETHYRLDAGSVEGR